MAISASSRWARWVGITGRRAGRNLDRPGPGPAVRIVVEPGPPRESDPDLGAALFDVCFAVVDVETTGGSPASSALTEIAAAKYRGGECVGEFQSLVDPGCDVPPLISLLTGITDAMVRGAPSVSSVLPSLLEFVHGSVIVGHNVGFDLSFLDAALGDNGYEPLGNSTLDTLALARRLVRPDVPNCKLRTLATALHLEHLPSHRALDDVRATADLLHRLIEHASGYDCFVLGDLIDLMAQPAPRARVSEVG
ncbi:MAG TPA: exonuclease domain-containing protein [Acidimicrobiales bacterium]|nr:exonuclease domain-containing protein [Acidimicrobiales bacterium]